MQQMILNSSNGNLFSIEQTCRNVCQITDNMCTVFAIYDMCKDLVENYPGLRRKTEKTIEVIDVTHGRGTGVDSSGE